MALLSFPPSQTRRLAAGVILAALGAAVLGALVYVFNCGTAVCERAMIDIGLAYSAALAAAAQFALIYGLWLIWLATRR